MKTSFHADVSPRNQFSHQHRSERRLKSSLKIHLWLGSGIWLGLGSCVSKHATIQLLGGSSHNTTSVRPTLRRHISLSADDGTPSSSSSSLTLLRAQISPVSRFLALNTVPYVPSGIEWGALTHSVLQGAIFGPQINYCNYVFVFFSKRGFNVSLCRTACEYDRIRNAIAIMFRS